MKHVWMFGFLLALLLAPVGALGGFVCQCDPVVTETHACCSQTASVNTIDTADTSKSCKICTCDITHTLSQAVLNDVNLVDDPVKTNLGFLTPNNDFENIYTKPLTTPPKPLV